METMAWNDEKIDALDEKVDAGFARTDGKLAHLEKRMDVRFAQMEKRMDVKFAQMETRTQVESIRTDEHFNAVGERFNDVDQRLVRVEGTMQAGFAELGGKFDALQRTIIQSACGLIGVLIIALVTLLATH